MANDEEYVYEIINDEATARICAQLLADEFSAHEPFVRFGSISSKQMFDEAAWPLMIDAFEERLSFLARHRSSDKIVAAIIANDLYFSHEKHPYNASGPPASIPIVDILDEMDDMFIRRDFGKELKPNMVLHISIGATLAEHAGQGVGTRLRAVMCDHARDIKGFQYALVQATNLATRHIYLNKMGGKVVTEVDSTTWIWKKKDDGTACPYKEFKGAPVPNILVELAQVKEK